MSDRIPIIKQEAVPGCGSSEVRFPDDRPSRFFYWDGIPARRLRPDLMDRETALEQAKAVVGHRDLLICVCVQNAWVSRAELPRGISKDGLPFATGPSLGRAESNHLWLHST